MITEMVRHHDQDERDLDGTVHQDSICPLLKKECQKKIGRIRTQEDWVKDVQEGINMKKFEQCLDAKRELVYI